MNVVPHMLSFKLPYVYEDVDRWGNVRTYFWRGRGHRKIRMRAPQGTADFFRAYHEAKALSEAGGAALGSDSRARPLARGTYRWLSTQYMGSPEFGRLDTRTQYLRRRELDRTCQEPIRPEAGMLFGDCPLTSFTPRHVRALRDRRKDRPGAADNRLKALRAVFKWAVANELIDTDPARDVAPIKGPSEGFHTWTMEEVRQFERRHPIGTKARLALGLLLYLGVRRSDVVRLGPRDVRDGYVSFVPRKLRRLSAIALELPILPALGEILAASPTGEETFLTTERGRPFSAESFGNWFRERCNEASLPHCSAHGLRKAGATTAAENGATTHQLMAMFGWSTMKEPERYTRKARQRVIADGGMPLLMPRQR